MLELPARRFTETTGILLAVATGVLGLGLERLARGATTLGSILLVLGAALTGLAFSLRVEGDPARETFMLVTRDECAHCEEARAILRDLQRDHGFSLWEVDVGQEADLQQRWGQQVPVLLHEGRVLAQLEVQAPDVEAVLGAGGETADPAR